MSHPWRQMRFRPMNPFNAGAPSGVPSQACGSPSGTRPGVELQLHCPRLASGPEEVTACGNTIHETLVPLTQGAPTPSPSEPGVLQMEPPARVCKGVLCWLALSALNRSSSVLYVRMLLMQPKKWCLRFLRTITNTRCSDQVIPIKRLGSLRDQHLEEPGRGSGRSADRGGRRHGWSQFCQEEEEEQRAGEQRQLAELWQAGAAVVDRKRAGARGQPPFPPARLPPTEVVRHC